MSQEWIILAVMVGVSLAGSLLISWRERRQRLRFAQCRAGRDDQSGEAFAAECGVDISRDIAERVRRILAKVSETAYAPPKNFVQPERLRASDELCDDLGFDVDSLAFANLYIELENEFGIALDMAELPQPPREKVTVAHVARAVVVELAKPPRPAADPTFQPGFRISKFDGVVLLIGAFATIFALDFFGPVGLLFAFIFGHFFLFCNVMRISRSLELIWSGIFLVLAGGAALLETPSWSTAIVAALVVTLIVIGLEMRKPSYHGVLWQRINPGAAGVVAGQPKARVNLGRPAIRKPARRG
jgi:acyl carrier protein